MSGSHQVGRVALCTPARRGGETETMVRIRLKKMGRRHQVFYRISAMDMRRPRDGRVLEALGWYDPRAKAADKQVSLNRERIEYWLARGAQPSDTVRDLLTRHGIAVKRAR
jgi:small subunit ribosomal protein S16